MNKNELFTSLKTLVNRTDVEKICRGNGHQGQNNQAQEKDRQVNEWFTELRGSHKIELRPGLLMGLDIAGHSGSGVGG